MGAPLTASHAMARDQKRAAGYAAGMMNSENHDGIRISAQDTDREVNYVIYIYNILDREYVVEQLPKWPKLFIPRCPKGEKYSFIVL